MFTVKVPDKIILYCKNLLKKHNFGNRGVADGSPEEQLTGLIGQCTLQKLFNQPLVTGAHGSDEGEDFRFADKIIDVKTMGRETDVREYYVNNFIALQKDFRTDVYIFCSLNKKTNILTICGWVTKPQLFQRASFFKKGEKRYRSDGTYFRTKADLYEIKNADISQANSLEELKEGIFYC